MKGPILILGSRLLGLGAVRLTNQNKISTFFLAPSVKTPTELEFELTVEDAFGISQTDLIKVLVNPVNTPPTVQLDEPQTYLETEEVSISASVIDEDGTVQSMSWEQTAGSPVALNQTNAAELTFTPPNISSTEQMAFRFSVIDDEGGKTQKAILVTIEPVLIPPTVSISKPDSARSLTKVLLTGEALDKDGELESVNWIQSSGSFVNLERSNENRVSFIAPNVEVATEVSFTFSAVDNDGLRSGGLAVITILPQEPLGISGYVAFGHEFRLASIEARRVVDGLVLDPAVGPAVFTEGPIGAFDLILPGEGRYELTASVILDSESGDQLETEDIVILKAVSDIKSGNEAVHINVLTHMASQVALKDPDTAHAQVALRLEPYLGMPAAEAETLHAFSIEDRRGSAYLVAVTEMLKTYSRNISTINSYQKSLARFLEFLPFQLGNPLSEYHFGQGLENLISYMDPVKINAQYLDSVEGVDDVSAVDIEERLDSDLDGLPNESDLDDDNDSISDVDDDSRLGYLFSKPLCQMGEGDDILSTGNKVFNIANRSKPDRYLNNRFGTLQASPLISPLEIGSQWNVVRVEGDAVFRFELRGVGVLSVSDQKKLVLLPEGALANLDAQKWVIQRAYSNPDVKIFHIFNKAFPELSLANFASISQDVYGVVVNNNHQDGAWSSEWGFCVSDEAQEETRYQIKSAPADFLQTACSDFEYDSPSPVESKTYLIQNSARVSQYLSRTDGLRSRPLRDGKDPGNQWRLIGLPFETQFLIRSQVDDALYLAVDGEGEPFLQYVPDLLSAGDPIKWVLEDSTIFPSGKRIKNVATDFYLDRNQQQPLRFFLLSHDIRMTDSSFPEFNQAWHFCEVPAS